MHPKFYAQRNAIAQDRAQAAARTLAETFGVDAPVEARDKNPEIARLKEAEALADFLESLAGSAGDRPRGGLTTDEVIARLENADGFGPKTLDAARQALEGDE